MDKMWNIFNSVRELPAIYLGENSFTLLYFFLKGCQIYGEMSEGRKINFLSGFDKFVQDKYQMSETYKYSDIIRIICTNEEQALYKFYALVDEFLESQQIDKIFIPEVEVKEEVALNNIWTIFYKVRENPEEYLGEPSLKLLNAFLTGCRTYANGKCKSFLLGFHKFIRLKYHVTKTYGTAGIIQHICKDEKEAFYKFYDLVDEFLELEKTDRKVAKYREEELNGDIGMNGICSALE